MSFIQSMCIFEKPKRRGMNLSNFSEDVISQTTAASWNDTPVKIITPAGDVNADEVQSKVIHQFKKHLHRDKESERLI